MIPAGRQRFEGVVVQKLFDWREFPAARFQHFLPRDSAEGRGYRADFAAAGHSEGSQDGFVQFRGTAILVD